MNASGLPVKFLRKDMNVNAQVLMTMLLYNISPRSHTSSIPIYTTCLLCCILDERQVDVMWVISNEIRMITSSGHRLGTRTPTTLCFPGLIMGLCRQYGVAIPSVVHGTIEGVVNDHYIQRNCTPRGQFPADAPPPPHHVQQQYDERVACMYTWDMLQAYQRAFSYMHDSMCKFQLQIHEAHVYHPLPTRDEFDYFVVGFGTYHFVL